MSNSVKDKLKGTANSHTDAAEANREVTTFKKRFNNAYQYLIEAGMGKCDIQAIFGMGPKSSTSQLVKYEKKNPDAIEAFKRGMEKLEEGLTGRIVSQAVGYDYTETKTIEQKDKDGEWVEVKRETNQKHNPGSAQMMILLMTNKFGDNWKMSKELVTRKEGYDSSPSERNRKLIKSYDVGVFEPDTEGAKGEHPVQDGSSRVSV